MLRGAISVNGPTDKVIYRGNVCPKVRICFQTKGKYKINECKDYIHKKILHTDIQRASCILGLSPNFMMDDMIHYDCGCKFGWVGQMMMRAGPAAAAAAAPIPANHPGSGSFKVHNVCFFLQWKYSTYLNWPALGFFTLCKYCKKAKNLMTDHLLNNLKGITLWLGEMEFNNVKKKWFRTQQLK